MIDQALPLIVVALVALSLLANSYSCRQASRLVQVLERQRAERKEEREIAAKVDSDAIWAMVARYGVTPASALKAGDVLPVAPAAEAPTVLRGS